MTKKKVAIYLHIPFCVQKCYYCDFLSAPAEERIKTLYVETMMSPTGSAPTETASPKRSRR